VTVIPLGCRSLGSSSDLPGACDAPSRHVRPKALAPYLILLRVGFTLPRPLLDARCALTAPFHPYPRGRYLFCGTGRPWAFTPKSRTLSGTLLCGVRTFLPHRHAARPNRRSRRRRQPSGPIVSTSNYKGICASEPNAQSPPGWVSPRLTRRCLGVDRLLLSGGALRRLLPVSNRSGLAGGLC
jgi:hypothetical protein